MKANAELLRQAGAHVTAMRAAATALRELLQLPEAPAPIEPVPARAGRKAKDDKDAHARMIELMRSECLSIPKAARRVAAEGGKAAGQESEAKRLERGLRDILETIDSMRADPLAPLLATGLRKADAFVAFTAEILPAQLRQLATECEAMAGAAESVRRRLAADVEAITGDEPPAARRRRRMPRRE